jgi:type III restriction enzyme
VILDSDWEGEFCRVAEAHPRVIAYVKNRNLGLEVPYRFGSENRTYIPDYIVQVDDGRGADDPLNLIVEIKGYRGEDAKEKAATMKTYWVPGVNHLKTHGRWAFAEFTDIYAIQDDFAKVVENGFNAMVDAVTSPGRPIVSPVRDTTFSEREAAQRLARLGGSDPNVTAAPRRRSPARGDTEEQP